MQYSHHCTANEAEIRRDNVVVAIGKYADGGWEWSSTTAGGLPPFGVTERVEAEHLAAYPRPRTASAGEQCFDAYHEERGRQTSVYSPPLWDDANHSAWEAVANAVVDKLLSVIDGNSRGGAWAEHVVRIQRADAVRKVREAR